EDVLHGMDLGLARGERRAAFRGCDVVEGGPDLRRTLQVHTAKPDPRVRGRRTEPDSRGFSRVQANAFQLGLTADRLLIGYGHASGVSRPRSARSRARMRLMIDGSLNSAACARSDSLWGRAGYPLYRAFAGTSRSEEHTSELQSRENLVCRLLLEKKKHEQT